MIQSQKKQRHTMTYTKVLLSTLSLGTLLFSTGCEVDDLTNKSDHDEITVSFLSADKLTVHWVKKYSGYSEVLAREEDISKRTGYFLTHNYKGDYKISCTISNYNDSSQKVSFDCTDIGSDSLPSLDGHLPDFKYDTVYTIQGSEGLEHDYQSVNTRLKYNSSAHKLEEI